VTRANPRDVAVVGEGSYLGESPASLVVVVVEQAELDPVGVLGINGEVRARPVVSCP
jgi:hypothetical protein